MDNNTAVLEQIRQDVLSNMYTLSTGVKVKFNPVSPSLAQEVISRIEDPAVPVVYIEEKGREEPNPNDPEYLKAVEEAEKKRYLAAIDVFMVEGIELLEDIPPVDSWLPGLKLLEKLGHFKIPDLDLENSIEVGFIYKKYKAIGQQDYDLIMEHYGVTEADIQQASDTFRG